MCKYFSCIVTKDYKVLWTPKTTSHEDLLEMNGIIDNSINDRAFVRIEVTPLNERKMTLDLKDWVYREDEDSTMPSWYKRAKAEPLVFAELEKSWKQQVFFEGVHRITDTVAFAFGDTEITAKGNSIVTAYDNTRVVAYNNTGVSAYDNCRVDAFGNNIVSTNDTSHCNASDRTRVIAFNKSTVKVEDNCTAEAYDTSKVIAYDNARVEAYRDSKVNAGGYSTVRAMGGSVNAKNSSIVRVESTTGRIHAMDRAVVIKEPFCEDTEVILSNAAQLVQLR